MPFCQISMALFYPFQGNSGIQGSRQVSAADNLRLQSFEYNYDVHFRDGGKSANQHLYQKMIDDIISEEKTNCLRNWLNG